MANPTPPERPSPWQPVHGGPAAREPVAPSKPSLPTTGSIPVAPQPIEDADAEVVAPVTPPDAEEIMPSSRGALWSAVPPRPEAQAPSAASFDPVRSLGDAAVMRASLGASGAPTPVAGVPRPDTGAVSASAPFSPTPWTPTTLPPRAGEGDAAHSDPAPSMDIPDLDDDQPAYTPPFGIATHAVASQADGGPTEIGPADGGAGEDAIPQDAPREPWFRSTPALIAGGLVLMAGIGYGAFLLFAPTAGTVELADEVLVAEPSGAALEPIAIEDPTDLQAAMPGVVDTWALTEAQTVAPAEAGLTARAAEVDVLTYADGTATLTLRAIQHYDTEAAVAQFEALAADGTDRAPVTAGGTEVGERATVPADDATTIVWRNGTAVMELTGPADAVEGFYAAFPL